MGVHGDPSGPMDYQPLKLHLDYINCLILACNTDKCLLPNLKYL